MARPGRSSLLIGGTFATVLAVVLAAVLLIPSNGARAGGPDLGDQISLGRRLATYPVPRLDLGPEDIQFATPASIRREGQQLARRIPFPPGSERTAIDRALSGVGGGDTSAGIQTVLEGQATCQWYRYALKHPNSRDARTVIDGIAQWPTSRATPQNAGAAAKAMASAFARHDTRPVRAELATNCR